MKLSDEYINQRKFRNWPVFLEQLEISPGDVILDMGCGIGDVTRLLADKGAHAIGIDLNKELIGVAESIRPGEDVRFIHGDVGSVQPGLLPRANGIWSSFVTAYFPFLSPVLKNWLELLKQGGWMAITEMNDLFGHEPLSESTRNTFRTYYTLQKQKGNYDFEMGNKLASFIGKAGMKVILEQKQPDLELTFNGPAPSDVMKSWHDRLERMVAFQEYLGVEKFRKVKNEFLECLDSPDHMSRTTVVFVVGIKN